MPATDLLRAQFLDSSRLSDSVGYRGLRRYCELAHAHGVRLIVAPVPEAEFRAYNAYAQGIDYPAIDRKVEQITRECGAVFISRSFNESFERRDELFHDFVHFSRTGRDLYTAALTREVVKFLK